MKVCWRSLKQAKNSYAALYAACELDGFILEETDRPRRDVTLYSLNSVTAPRLFEEIRGAECITVAGGPYPSACWKEVSQYADFVVVGEGEETLPRLLAHIDSGGTSPIPGVATEEGYIPARRSVILDAYPPFTRVCGTIEITRGCPNRCTYCQTPRLSGGWMRHRSIDSIRAAASRYHDIRFVTPNALAYGSDGRNIRLDRVERLLSSLEGNIYFGTFPGEVRPEHITEESLDIVSRYSAASRIHFGAQSGSDRVLARLRRGHTTDDVLSALDLCREFGITPVVDFILGFPFETPEDQKMTLSLIRETVRQGRAHIHRFLPLPGTPLQDAPAGRVIPEVERALGRLAQKGHITGSIIPAEVKFSMHDRDSDT
ncbi:MAG: TIGR04013 family B12-binding domain/radical SAM domain-containing protein [Methanoculleaceae archaeon]